MTGSEQGNTVGLSSKGTEAGRTGGGSGRLTGVDKAGGQISTAVGNKLWPVLLCDMCTAYMSRSELSNRATCPPPKIKGPRCRDAFSLLERDKMRGFQLSFQLCPSAIHCGGIRTTRWMQRDWRQSSLEILSEHCRAWCGHGLATIWGQVM